MNKRFHLQQVRFIHQLLFRVSALSISVLSVIVARQYISGDASNLFFSTLTDSVILTAFSRLGADTYFSACSISNLRKLQVNKYYLSVLHLCSLIMMILSFINPFNLALFYALGVSSIVVQFCVFAEIFRARGNFLFFYLSKSPVIYIFSLLWALLVSFGVLDVAKPILLVFLCLIIFTNSRLVDFSDNQVDFKFIVGSAVFSSLLVFFSWKDAFVLRIFADSDSLETIVFYGRLKLIVLFVFALYNARIPNIIRSFSKPPLLSQLRTISSDSLSSGLLWATLTSVPIIFYSKIYDPSVVPIISILLLTNFVTIFFGNLNQVFVGIRRTGYLSIIYFISLFVFGLLFLVLQRFFDTLPSLVWSTLIVQILVGCTLYIDLPRNLERAVSSGQWALHNE